MDAAGAVERLPRLGWFWRGMHSLRVCFSHHSGLRHARTLKTNSPHVEKHTHAPLSQGLVIFHGNLNKEWLEGILEESSMSGVLLKPLGVDNLTREMYSGMFCEAQFYDNFPTTHVLVFQTDVVMRRRIPAKFFDFAYVGSPFTLNSYLVSRGGNVAEVHFGFDGGLKCIGNGGYSLRNVEEMKRLFAATNWLEWNRRTVRDLFGGQWGESDGERPAGEAKDKQIHPRDVVVHEDIFIGSLTDSARLPFNHEATEFGVESIWHPDPTGMHRPFFPSYRAPAAFLKAGEWQNPPWSENCPERPLWEDRFISTDMFESLLECVADPCVASDAHRHSKRQPSDMMLPEKAREQMQNAPHPVPYRVEKRDIQLGAGVLPQCNLLMPMVSGLKWEEIGGKAPERGSELHNVELASALQRQQEFSIEEVNKFGFLSFKQGLPYDCFVNVNGKYFKPAADWWQRVSSE